MRSLAEGSGSHEAEPVITDFWQAADRQPAGHEASLARLRSLILSTQQPATCTRICRLASAYHGGALADVRRIAYALMYAVTHDCSLTGNWPYFGHTANGSAFITTNPEMRQRCTSSGRKGLRCYFLPTSTCDNVTAPTATRWGLKLDQKFHLGVTLDKVRQRTGLRSEVLIMGTLVAWVMRPQPELREAILRYGTAAGLAEPGARHRRIAMHVRHGDKHSLYSKHMKEHGWRVGAQSFDAWGRRVAADIGAERALYMTDDPRVMSALESSGDDFFRLVPAPRNCMPSYAAGVLGKHHIPAATTLSKMHQKSKSDATSLRAADASAACGPRYLVDDGIQLFAGVYLLGQCAALIGTQISNIDAAAVELQATLRHPPTFYDVLNDMHRACLSDEHVWFAGTNTYTRTLANDRLALGFGNYTDGNC